MARPIPLPVGTPELHVVRHDGTTPTRHIIRYTAKGTVCTCGRHCKLWKHEHDRELLNELMRDEREWSTGYVY